MRQVDIAEAKEKLVDLIEATIDGEYEMITNNEHTMVRLVPIVLRERHPQFGSARGLVKIADDFDEPLEDFAEYME